MPGGRSATAGTPEADALVSEVLGRRLRLARETDVPHHDEAPVHVVPPRPCAGFPEDGWAGGVLALGNSVLRLLGRERDTFFGIRALVERGGVVRVGDAVSHRRAP